MALATRYGRWDVSLPDEKYVWEPDEMTLAQWVTLESELGGITFSAWVTGIDNRDAEPCQVLIWWLRRQAGQQMDRALVDFKIRQLDLVKIEEKKTRARRGGDPDPEASAG